MLSSESDAKTAIIKKVSTVSRSKLELFLDCPRCFYLDRVLGVARPEFYSYALNLAVDHLLKKEFDTYRNAGEPHPLMLSQGIEAVPFFHLLIDDWREAARGIRALHEDSGLTVFGAPDDLWELKNGDIAVVDYKCTGRPSTGPGTGIIRDSYQRQVEVYQWILRKMGFNISDSAYFVFAAPNRNPDAFLQTLHFTMSISSFNGDDGWVSDAVSELKKCLDRDTPPTAKPGCVWCSYAAQATTLPVITTSTPPDDDVFA